MDPRPPLGYLYHPTSIENAYNLLVSDIDEDKNVTLKGFVSNTRNGADGDWSYEQMKTELLQAYNKPLTLGDLNAILKERHNVAIYTDNTYDDALRFLQHSQPKAFNDALKVLMELQHADTPGLDERFKSPTKLMPPPANSIRGVATHNRARESIGPGALIHADQDSTIIPVNPDISVDTALGNILSIPGYRTELPHQRLVLKAAEDFLMQMREQNNVFSGLILFGGPGTGKTMACEAIANTAKTDGKKVWSVKFEDESTLFNAEERASALDKNWTKGKNALYDEALEKYADAWHNTDLIYVDDTNTTSGSLNDVSNAAIIFARKHKKAIIINSNTNPAEILRDSIETPFDNISIYNIQGPDSRITTSWYQTCEPRKAQPSNFPFAANCTQIDIYSWLHALHTSSGQNGLAIYGKPGIGKTTAIRTFFADANIPKAQAIWVDPVSTKNIDASSLNQSEAQYLIVDDCNEPRRQAGYQKLMNAILHNLPLFNKHGEAIKIILVSNRSAPSDLVKDTAGLLDSALTPRMESRYHGRFKTLLFDEQHDFRAADMQRQLTIIQSSIQDSSDKSNTFDLDGFLTTKREITNRALANYDSSKSIGFLRAGKTSVNQQLWNQRKALEDRGFERLENAQNIQLSMSNSTLIDFGPHWWAPIIKRALDVIEHNPKATLQIQSTDDPNIVLNSLFKGLDEIDKTGMYQSRLKRMVVSGRKDA